MVNERRAFAVVPKATVRGRETEMKELLPILCAAALTLLLAACATDRIYSGGGVGYHASQHRADHGQNSH